MNFAASIRKSLFCYRVEGIESNAAIKFALFAAAQPASRLTCQPHPPAGNPANHIASNDGRFRTPNRRYTAVTY
jgi:hypothetical protein